MQVRHTPCDLGNNVSEEDLIEKKTSASSPDLSFVDIARVFGSSSWISVEGVIEDKDEELHLQENKKPKSKKQKEFDSQQWDQVKDEDEHEDK
jgi:hypothetical protein